MRELTESYLKVQYELRPAKQVERRMLIDAFRRLSGAGFGIEDYEYVGFGSIYFVDFILFHKFLGINSMLSVEYAEMIEKRVRFNKPYDFIRIIMKPVGEVIPTLSPDLKYIVWLDYDFIIDSELLQDVRMAAAFLPVGSILLITIDSKPPDDLEGPVEWMAYYEEHAGNYLGLAELQDFSKSNLHKTNVNILHRAIKDGIAARNVLFLELFNFAYSDGHQMTTVGGVIGTKTEKRKIDGSKLNETLYIRRDFKKKPYHIRVPKVTRKERLYLDSAMPSPEGWIPDEFELPQEDLEAYREIYAFFPAYAELLL